MIKVIGKIGCNACIAKKEELTEQGVEFEYILYEDQDIEARREIAKLVRNNGGYFPLIVNE